MGYWLILTNISKCCGVNSGFSLFICSQHLSIFRLWPDVRARSGITFIFGSDSAFLRATLYLNGPMECVSIWRRVC